MVRGFSRFTRSNEMNSSEYIKAINSAFDQCVFVSREAMMHALITIRKIEALTLELNHQFENMTVPQKEVDRIRAQEGGAK